MALTIVKLGGSYAHGAELRDIAAALAQGGGRAVIVPGGGPFADLVRVEQGRIGFDAGAAHRMALLAMAQFGLALASLAPGLQPCATFDDIRATLAQGGAPVWLPLGLPAAADGVVETWKMTSDSVAAWLAGKLDADRLIVVKRADPPRPLALTALVAAGILDPLAPAYLARTRAEPWFCGPGDLAGLGPALAEGKPIGARIFVP